VTRSVFKGSRREFPEEAKQMGFSWENVHTINIVLFIDIS